MLTVASVGCATLCQQVFLFSCLNNQIPLHFLELTFSLCSKWLFSLKQVFSLASVGSYNSSLVISVNHDVLMLDNMIKLKHLNYDFLLDLQTPFQLRPWQIFVMASPSLDKVKRVVLDCSTMLKLGHDIMYESIKLVDSISIFIYSTP